MPRAVQARAWWADVEDVRERIEHKRALERRARRAAGAPSQRAVREVRPGRHLMLVRSEAAPARDTRRRPRPRPRVAQRVGPRPDMVAAWAVVLGIALVLAAVLSAHG